MAVPDFQTIMLPLLKAVGDGKSHSIGQLYEAISDTFDLSEEEREQLLPSGRETIIKNRVAWARTYMKKAGLLSSPDKGMVRITARGKDVLSKNPKRIDNRFLRRFPEFNKFRPRSGDESETKTVQVEVTETPEEQVMSAWQELRDELATELLDEVKRSKPRFFEYLVVDLMIALGYGGSRKEAGEATRQSKDGGIDGVIREDKLGLEAVYLQAKKYDGSAITVSQVRDFAGALQAVRARKGVFITTSTFTQDAREYVDKIENRIVLIDGETLVKLMIDHDVGVSTREVLKLKQVDSDYFAER